MDDFALRGFQFASSTTYSVVEELGRGGMGIVYLVEKNCEGVLDYVVFKGFKTLNEEQEARLRNEANIATFLRHENIVRTYGLEACRLSNLPERFRQLLGADQPARTASDLNLPSFELRRKVDPRRGGRTTPGIVPARMPNPQAAKRREQERKLHFMVMDYIDGSDVGALIRHHFRMHLLMPIKLSMFLVSRVARALAYAHEWIVHKDVTPGNILISNEGVPKLADFGIAAPHEAAGEEFAGKVHYMAPEQLAHQAVSPASDVFTLGVVAYELLTGINLFKPQQRGSWEENVEYVMQAQGRTIVPPHEIMPDIPKELSLIIMKMLALDPRRRYRRMIEAQLDLEKKFLFAEGFGPSNDSLAAYLRIFESGFQRAERDDLRQLTFLTNEHGRVAIHRRIHTDAYTAEGIMQIRARRRSPLYHVLTRQKPASIAANPAWNWDGPLAPDERASSSASSYYDLPSGQ